MFDDSEPSPHVHASLAGFTRVELEVMRRDGDIQRHGIRGLEFYLPIGVLPTQLDRAASLQPLWRDGRVFVGSTAKWVLDGGRPPDTVEIARKSTRKPKGDSGNVKWVYRKIPPQDRLHLAGIDVHQPTTQRRSRRGTRNDCAN